MINFIKDAVTAVSGIKSFLFNTDYRNNFDLQNVEFPCCVLTPIMRTNYDLNNIIRESAELQLSVVDLAPYEYSGDDLYAINKRCSDLALQVIANLQVKSKLDKELAFEFILPSGDELISGVMCNLQCTMKQGSCIGAPSYVEVVVQPVKRESITTNGKHVIIPSSGFNAMREVEVDVNVDLKGSLQDKQVTITENGTQTITADSEFEGLSSVEVTTDVNTLQGLDFSELGRNEGDVVIQNSILKDEINSAVERGKKWTEQSTSSDFWGGERTGRIYYFYTKLNCPNLKILNIFNNCPAMTYINIDEAVENCNNLDSCEQAFTGNYAMKIVKLGNINYSNVTNAVKMFSNCWSLKEIDWGNFKDAKLLTMTQMFNDSCFNIETIDFSKITTKYCENMSSLLYYSGGSFSQNTKRILGLDMTSCTKATNIFKNRISILEIEITNWGKCNLSLNTQKLLSSSSIRYIIWHALNGENSLGFENEGATSRTLQLHATPYASWEEWKTTKPSVEDCEYLGIDEAEIAKYGELTWEDIALSIKLITIGA